MVTATRVLEFDAGHRLPGHEGKCRFVHGHRYRLELQVAAPEFDALGRVIDFGEVKKLVGGWIDDQLDHGFIVSIIDTTMLAFLRSEGQRYFTTKGPPTAEALVELIAWNAQQLLYNSGITVVGARLYETPNCYVDWRPSELPR